MQVPRKAAAKQYAGRSEKKIVRTLTLPREVDDLILRYSDSGKGYGAFISRCIYEHHVRRLWESELLTRMARERGPDAA